MMKASETTETLTGKVIDSVPGTWPYPTTFPQHARPMSSHRFQFHHCRPDVLAQPIQADGHVSATKGFHQRRHNESLSRRRSLSCFAPVACAARRCSPLQELRHLIYDKWGKSYEARIHRREGRMYLQIMWKFLEQQSFPLTEEQYNAQLDAVAELCAMWGVSGIVRSGIRSAAVRGPGLPIGTGASARAIQILLGKGLDMLGGGC
jgi:hypothetical protein